MVVWKVYQQKRFGFVIVRPLECWIDGIVITPSICFVDIIDWPNKVGANSVAWDGQRLTKFGCPTM